MDKIIDHIANESKKNHTEESREKIASIIEILPMINELSGEFIVVHVPIEAIAKKDILVEIAKEICLIKQLNLDIIVVCDSNIDIHYWMREFLKIPFDNSNHDTNYLAFIFETIMRGHVGSMLAAEITKNGANAICISGKDSKLIVANQSSKLDINIEKGVHELKTSNFNVEIANINPEILTDITETSLIPIILPIATDFKQTKTLIVNSIDLSARLAQNFLAEKLIIGTAIDGITNIDGNIITAIGTKDILLNKIPEEQHGILKKSENAVSNGVKSAHIVNLTAKYSLLLEVFTKQGTGTMIYNNSDISILK